MGSEIEIRHQILDSPDDLELRLVYADSLMSAGDPRGEWIALSCAEDGEDEAGSADAACVIRRIGDRLELAKESGPQRFTGTIVLESNGFHFAGHFECGPLVDCRGPATGVFKQTEHGELLGVLALSSDAMSTRCREICGSRTGMTVRLVPGRAFGGDTYGGALDAVE